MAIEEEIMRFQSAVVSEYANSRPRKQKSGCQKDKNVLEIGVFGNYVKITNHYIFFETLFFFSIGTVFLKWATQLFNTKISLFQTVKD